MEDNIRLCNHCNNVTSHQLIADGYSNKIIGEISIGGKKEKTRADFTYFFMKCNTCEEHSLLGGFNDQLSNKKFADVPVLFPNSNILDSSIPLKIRRVYEEAAQIKNKIPNAYATQIRRALEYLCKDKKAKGKELLPMLDFLVKTGIIPPAVYEMTTVIRLLGNIGAHAKNDDLTLSDANDIDLGFRFIIEYVYVAPARSKQAILNLESRQLESKYGDLLNEIQSFLIDEGPCPWMEEDDDGPPSYLYEEETVAIVKKLKEMQSESQLLDYIHEELKFSYYNQTVSEEFVNHIWNLWESYNLNNMTPNSETS